MIPYQKLEPSLWFLETENIFLAHYTHSLRPSSLCFRNSNPAPSISCMSDSLNWQGPLKAHRGPSVENLLGQFSLLSECWRGYEPHDLLQGQKHPLVPLESVEIKQGTAEAIKCSCHFEKHLEDLRKVTFSRDIILKIQPQLCAQERQ